MSMFPTASESDDFDSTINRLQENSNLQSRLLKAKNRSQLKVAASAESVTFTKVVPVITVHDSDSESDETKQKNFEAASVKQNIGGAAKVKAEPGLITVKSENAAPGDTHTPVQAISRASLTHQQLAGVAAETRRLASLPKYTNAPTTTIYTDAVYNVVRPASFVNQEVCQGTESHDASFSSSPSASSSSSFDHNKGEAAELIQGEPDELEDLGRGKRDKTARSLSFPLSDSKKSRVSHRQASENCDDEAKQQGLDK